MIITGQFPLLSKKMNAVRLCWNCLTGEAIPKSSHSIHFYGMIKKITPCLAPSTLS